MHFLVKTNISLCGNFTATIPKKFLNSPEQVKYYVNYYSPSEMKKDFVYEINDKTLIIKPLQQII